MSVHINFTNRDYVCACTASLVDDAPMVDISSLEATAGGPGKFYFEFQISTLTLEMAWPICLEYIYMVAILVRKTNLTDFGCCAILIGH